MRVAVITGGGGGIGLAAAHRFLARGDAVVAIGRDPGRLERLTKAAGANASRVAVLAIDATAEEAPARTVKLALSAFGRLDFLVNNAGIGAPTPVHETDDATLDAHLDLMLRTPFRFIRECLPALGQDCAIVNVSSTYGIVGGLRGGPYSAAKAGLIGLTTHVACQYGSSGVRCNAVAPGFIETEMTAARLESESYRRIYAEMTPSPRVGTVDDVASMITYLCSDDGGWINGQVIAVDGGWSSTKFLSEEALAARRELVEPKFSHSGRAKPAQPSS